MANIPDSLYNLLYKAFSAESKKESDSLFNASNNLLKNDTAKAYQTYFKFYYHQLNKNKDSLDYYSKLAEKQLYNTKQYPEYFKVINNRFWDFIDQSKYDQALKLGYFIKKKAQQLKDTFRWIEINAHWAIVYHDIGQYQKGIKEARKGLIYIKNNRFNRSSASCYNAIGICFDDWGKYDSAIYYHRKNLKILKKKCHT